MIRELLQGESANVPVDPALKVVLNSPDGAVNGLRHAAAVSDAVWAGHAASICQAFRSPSPTWRLRRSGGGRRGRGATWSDEVIKRIVTSWPRTSQRVPPHRFADDKPFIEAVRDFAASMD